MARTLVGQLILRLKAEGLGEANKVQQALANVDRAVKRMGTVGSWGVGFQKQLAALKLAPADLRQVEQSWVRLHDSIKQNNLDKSLRGNAISQWKTNTIAELAQARGDWDRHYAAIERNTRAHAARMQGLMKPLFVSMGFYTGAYGGGLVIRDAMMAASERSRVEAENYFRGLSPEERAKIEGAADGQAEKRRVSKTNVMEIAADAAMSFPDTDAALSTLDSQISAFKIWSNTYGPEAAIAQLRAFNRAMDNINVTDPTEYQGLLNNFVKAWQVTGKDIDAGQFAQAIKYARSSGKVFSHDFLSRVLPFIMAETSGSDAGVQMRGIFDQFVVGRATKSSITAQTQYGLRGNDGTLIGQAEFALNPMDWAQKYLLPALEKNGVDMGDEVELARVIGTLTNNRVTSDAFTKMLLGWDQMQRLLNDRFPNAHGLATADKIDEMALGPAWQGLATAFENLAAGVVPVQAVIIPALNGLADAMNALAAEAEANPLATSLGIGAGVAGAAYGGKKVFDAISGGFGLKASAVALDGSAAALTRAAVALGGAAAVDGIGPRGSKTPKGGRPTSGGAGVLGGFAGGLFGGPAGWVTATALLAYEIDRIAQDNREQIGEAGFAKPPTVQDESNFGGRSAASPREAQEGSMRQLQILVNSGEMEAVFEDAKRGAAETGQSIEQSLAVTARPSVDTSSLANAVAMAHQLAALLREIGSLVQQSNATVGQELRRNFAD